MMAIISMMEKAEGPSCAYIAGVRSLFSTRDICWHKVLSKCTTRFLQVLLLHLLLHIHNNMGDWKLVQSHVHISKFMET